MFMHPGLNLRSTFLRGAAIPLAWARALLLEGSLPAVAFDGISGAAPAYGPELVSNGTFDTDLTGWGQFSNVALTTPTTGVTVTSGVASIARAGAPDVFLTQTVNVTAGKLYEYRFTKGGANGNYSTQQTAPLSASATATNGTTTLYFTAVGSTFVIAFWASAGNTITIDNVSCREVMLGELGTNLGASGYTMGTQGGTASASESPTGTLNLAGDGTFTGFGDKSFTTVVGRHYRIVGLSSNAQITCRVGTSQGGNQIAQLATTVGVTNIEFTATATTTWVRFDTITAGTKTFSSITIAEWTPSPTLRSATFDELTDFTCGSAVGVRTRVGPDGLIKADVGIDEPRVDYSNGRARYLFENQSTNLAIRSDVSSGAGVSWVADNSGVGSVLPTITANHAVAPDGTTTACRIQANRGSGTLSRVQQFRTSTAGVHTFSVWMRTTSGTGTANVGLRLDVGSTTVAVTGSWQRFTLSYTTLTTAADIQFITWTSMPSTDVSFDILVWGAQLEAQSFASSYIPTTSATVTRLIETPRFSPLVEAIFQLPGATARVQAQLRFATGTTRRILGNAGASNAHFIATNGADTGIELWNGSAQVLIAAGSGLWTTGGGAVIAFNSSGRSGSMNGATAAGDSNAVVRTAPHYLARNDTVGAGQYGDGFYQSFALYPFRATNANVSAIAVAP
jgi:hypothetical protein